MEHCNRPQHLRRAGLPSVEDVKRSTASDIRARLAARKGADGAAPPKAVAKPAAKGGAGGAKRAREEPEDDDKKKKNEEDVAVEPLEFDAAAMGLPASFGGSAK